MWEYRLVDFDPKRDGDEEAWAHQVAAEGWRTWTPGPGQWIELHGRRVRRWSLRRGLPVVKPGPSTPADEATG